ncbi:hypothetical protein QTP88_002343 [Uroleucon formosanum]
MTNLPIQNNQNKVILKYYSTEIYRVKMTLSIPIDQAIDAAESRLSVRGGGSSAFPDQFRKIARQRSSPPSPSPSPNPSDSETIGSFSDTSSSTLFSASSDISVQIATPTSVPKPTKTFVPKPNQTSVPNQANTSALNKTTSAPNQTTSASKQSTSTPNQTTTSAKTIRPPPIILSSSSWRKIAPTIYILPNLTPSTLSAKSSANSQVTIQTSDPSQFRLIQSALLLSKTEFHTFSLPEERSLKVVLKGIPTDIPTEEVKEELETLGFCLKFIRRFGTPDKPMPLCLVHITSSEIAKDILLLTSLFYIQISIEPLKSDEPAQCFSCQRFGHGCRNCGHPLRCVKCAGNHSAKDCQKTLDKSHTCCNCGGPHTANFRGCPQYLAQIQPKPVTPSQTNPKLNCPWSIHTNAKPNLTPTNPTTSSPCT